ncbi:cell division protein FtsL [Bartonella sp. A05]|uniref:cell division protein FtsL n=1 Tax=Bartonella sp. A05 TaxID=2967261 RepID=UPI0022A9F0B7|nr:hypothetical protein [Bartonella sp. A05]MCZ2204067.1 hypothetical protein [Bartonella sp. A05]
MVVFRTLDMVLVVVMIGMAGITYKIKYDVQKQISEVRNLEQAIAAEKNMVNLFHAEWAVMIEPSRMEVLAVHYKKELGLEIIQPRQVVELKDIPMRVHDPIKELIKQNTFEEEKAFLADNRIFHIKKGRQ